MVLLAKLIVSLALFALLLLSFKIDLSRIKTRQFTILAWTSLAFLRVVVFVVLYMVMNLTPQSDNTVYYSEARAALTGGLIYRDFGSSYGPLFTYMDAAAVYLWDSPKSIVLFAIVIEIATFPLWMYLARRAFDETTCRSASLLYLLSPLPLFAVGVTGQNQSLGAAYLAIAILLLINQRDALAGLVMGLAIPGVKFLMALFAPITWAFSRQKLNFLITWLIFPIGVCAILWFAHADPTVPFQIQVNDQTSGNLPFFAGLLGANATSSAVRRCFDLFTLISLATVFLLHAFRTKTSEGAWLVNLCSVVGLTFMLCSKKSYTTYLVLFYFPLCISVARAGFSVASAVQFGIFNCIATLEPSLSFRWITNLSEAKIPSVAFLSRFHDMPFLVSLTFIVINVALVSFYLRYLLSTSRVMYLAKLRSVSEPSATAQTELA